VSTYPCAHTYTKLNPVPLWAPDLSFLLSPLIFPKEQAVYQVCSFVTTSYPLATLFCSSRHSLSNLVSVSITPMRLTRLSEKESVLNLPVLSFLDFLEAPPHTLFHKTCLLMLLLQLSHTHSHPIPDGPNSFIKLDDLKFLPF
jgi:hypothetical protein